MTVIPLVLTLGLAAYGIFESRRHIGYLTRIPIRVHVNGTRGKSSVTRLIAAGLTAGGIRTFAMTTGTTARMIGVDGTEVDVFRVGSPNIIEQTRIVRRAAEQEAQALAARNYPNRGVLNVLAERRIPVMHLLDVEKLARRLGIQDVTTGATVQPATGLVFIKYKYNLLLVCASAIAILLANLFVLRIDLRHQILGRPHPEGRPQT